ncbi:MAG: PEP-utilizing enzyme [Candidatus Uhrbacteria bacterium]|nr:PEP-utilizing enzyme [Candidatus Uhrbacteria bacterium]
MDLSKLYQTQISFTEWLQNMGHAQVEAHRKEDNDKRVRLAVLADLIGLPFDRPTQFSASDVAARAPMFIAFVDEHANELCAYRMIPNDAALPKLRTRGASVRDTLKWFDEQQVDFDKYVVDIVPHAESYTWSTIFVVNANGAIGQIVPGVHSQLTQGFYDDGHEPITFAWDFSDWSLSESNDEALEHLKKLVDHLHVGDAAVRDQLSEQLGAEFAHDHLNGYFETVTSHDAGTWFVDYNRLLGQAYAALAPRLSKQGALRGQIGSPGAATGKARVIYAKDLEGQTIERGHILVTDMTTPAFLPLMRLADAVVTAQGGILSHAAIVCRELGIPCITNVKDIFDHIADGTMISVDANEGVVEIL